MARKGLSVVLFEREHFPRHHVGESLLPATLPFLEQLGALHDVERAGFLKKWGATMVWGREKQPWSWYFRETNTRHPHSYQVSRADFDHILLKNSAQHGVDVREGHRVTRALFEGPRCTGVAFQAEDGREQTALASFVVDASGQLALLGRHLRLRDWDDLFHNLAVYAYFKGGHRLPEPDENNIFIESYDGGWMWSIPLHTGVMSVGAVADSRRGQEELANRPAVDFFRSELQRSPATSRMLEAAELVSGASVVRDWSYRTANMVGDGYVLVGDAACFVDPLFSSGVHMAIMSGAMAAAYVATALDDPVMAGPAALFYEESYREEYNNFRTLARLFYATNRSVESYFWEARRLLGSERQEQKPRDAFIRLVAGRPPRGYERAILQAGDLPDGFAEDLSAVEEDKRRRLTRISTLEHSGTLAQSLLSSRPSLKDGVRLQRQPEIREGEFHWGYAIARADERLGEPCDELTATLLARLDGQTSLNDAVHSIVAQTGLKIAGQIRDAAIGSLRQLYIDGLISGLE